MTLRSDERIALRHGPDGPTLAREPLPQGRPDQALVKVLALGICRTDIACARGALPKCDGVLFGHEFSGLVERSGRFPEGTLVSADPRVGDAFMGIDAEGACADRIWVDEDRLHAFAAGTNPFVAALFEPVCASIAPSGLLSYPQSSCAVVGRGRLAAMAAMALSERASVQLLSPEQAASAPKNAFDFVCETSASEPGVVQSCLDLLRPGGTLCLKSRLARAASFDPASIVAKGLTVRGILYGDWTQAARFVERRGDELAAMVGAAFPVERWREALDAAEAGEDAKTFILPGAGL